MTSTIVNFVIIAGANLDHRCAWRRVRVERKQYQCFLICLPMAHCPPPLVSNILPNIFAMCSSSPITNDLSSFTNKFSPLLKKFTTSNSNFTINIEYYTLNYEKCSGELHTRILCIYNFSRKVFRESLRLFITFPGINFPLWKMWIYSEAPATTDTLAYGDSALLQSLS